MTKPLACIAAVAVVFGGLSVSADARGKHKRHAHRQQQQPRQPASFDGSCTFSGAVTFTPPMTSAPQPIAQHAAASGSCSGDFVDARGRAHRLDNAPAAYRAESTSDQASCAFGLASGTGTLAFPYGEIAFTMHEYRAAAAPVIRLDGRGGGGAWMPVTPSPNADPLAAVQACNSGGLDRFELDAHLTTDGAIRG